MSRRKQAKPRSLKGQNLRLNIKEDCEDVRKERSSWERRKKRDKESGRYVQKKDKDVKEHRCAESLQVSESFTQQRLKFCHGAVKPDVKEDAISCLGLSLSSGDSSPEHKNGCDLGVKEEDLPKCSKEETHRDHQWLGQCGKTNTPFPGSSLVPFPEIFPKHFSSDTSTNSKQTCTSQYNLASALPFHHLSDINDPQNHLGSCEKMQLSNVECACTSKTTPHSSQSSPATPMTADLAFKPATSCAEKRKSLFLSNNSFGIQFTKQLKVFNSCVHCHNHMDPKACRQTQLMDIEVPSGQLYSEIPAVSSKLKEQQKDADVMLGHSVLLEAAITAAVETVLQCSFCPKSLTGPKALQEHVRQSHNSSVIENNVFFCSECFRGFLTKDTLENHVQQTHCKKQSQSLDPDLLEESAERKSLLFCPYCTHLPTFSSKLKLIQHVKITHKNINLINLKEGKRTLPQSVKGISEKISQCVHPSTDFICDHCGAKYTSLDLFQTHLGSHLKSMLPKFTCPECFKDFPNRESLDKHTVAHFSNTSTLHICESCSKSFTNVKDLQGHLLEMHTIVFYRCALCQQVFSSKVSIEVHLATKHSNKRTTFHCTSCEWDFKQEQDLHLHIKRKHLDKQCKIYCCIFCAESFNTDIELQCHITTHSDKSSPCVCTKTNSPIEVPLHGNLSAKSQSAEGDNVTPPPVSEPVAKDGTGRLPVNNEIRDGKVESLNPPTESKGKVNMSDPMFACEICGASYTMQSLLTNHQLRDHHIQPGESGTLKRKVEAIQGSHKCKDCSKTFFTEMALWEHVQTHLGPTKHCQCPICGERFPSLLTLTEHKVTHSRSLDTGNCRICKLPLHSEEDFLEHCQRHPDLHNSLTGFRCVVCMQTVTSTIELKIHGTFHMQKVQGIGLINSCTDPANQNPDLKISSSVAQQEMVNMDVSKFEHRLRDSKTNISVVNCCLATALNPDERSTKNTLAQTTTV